MVLNHIRGCVLNRMNVLGCCNAKCLATLSHLGPVSAARSILPHLADAPRSSRILTVTDLSGPSVLISALHMWEITDHLLQVFHTLFTPSASIME